jgi:hypothetical protein
MKFFEKNMLGRTAREAYADGPKLTSILTKRCVTRVDQADGPWCLGGQSAWANRHL